MSTTETYPPLIIDDSGTARIGSTRYKVIHLAAEHYQHGWTAEELLRQHPDLRPEQVYAALAYFYAHQDDLVVQMKREAEATEAANVALPLSRDELLRRRSQPTD